MASKTTALFAPTTADEDVSARAGAAAVPSFEAVYREHFAFAWRTARRMSVREANVDDVVQDVFVVVHRRLRDYDGRTSMRGWLYGILVRVVADHRRRVRRKDAPCRSVEDDERGAERFESSAPGPAEQAERGEALALLERILGEMSADHREVLVLSRLEEMSVPEIAECLGANVNTIYSRLRAAAERFDALYAQVRGEEANQDGRRAR